MSFLDQYITIRSAIVFFGTFTLGIMIIKLIKRDFK